MPAALDGEALVIDEGTQAPDFELTSDAGETVRLSDLRGRPVVHYFYPEDDTKRQLFVVTLDRPPPSSFVTAGGQRSGTASPHSASTPRGPRGKERASQT
jgi:hypothetical protein